MDTNVMRILFLSRPHYILIIELLTHNLVYTTKLKNIVYTM